MTTLSAAVLLFLVMDPVGNTPVFISLLSSIEPRRARAVVIRELLIALGVLIADASWFDHILGKRGTIAVQRLSGMLLTTVAVQMFLNGIRQFFSLA